MLRHVKLPTMVKHGKDDPLYPVQHGKYYAEHIPGARYLELDSNYHIPMFDPNAVPVLQEGIEQFITTLPPSHFEDSSARIISTEQPRDLGDRAWTEKISAFEANTTTIVEQCRGKVIRFTGDGVKAAFEVPGDGLRAARLLVNNASELGHPIRVGLHKGEVQWSDEDLHGMAVNIASRVTDQADAGEVLTTTVAQGIVEGGDYAFSDWG